MFQHSKRLLAVLSSSLIVCNTLSVDGAAIAGYVYFTPNQYTETNYENPTQYIFENYDVWGSEDYEEITGIEIVTHVENAKYTDPEIDLLKHLVMDEAGGTQPEYGIRLVCDVVLNRVASDRFPDTIYEVITQTNQFEDGDVRYYYGYTPRNDVSELVDRVVEEEIIDRTNNEVLFYTAGGYNPYCVPGFQVADHYFGY